MFSASQRKEFILKRASQNGYIKYLGIEITDIEPDTLSMKMPIVAERLCNSAGAVHGGAIMSLADTVMGFACVNAGELVTTMDMNINFIKSVRLEGHLKAAADIIHHGRQTMVVEARIYNFQDQLVAKARGTFFITGKIENFA